MNVILNVVPANVITAFGSNTAVLAVVFVAVCLGLCMNALGEEKTKLLRTLVQEVNDVVVVFLNYVVTTFAPFAVLVLLARTFATCTDGFGVDDTIASFVLPLGMTINMNGTAIMQVIATVFIAGCAGYEISLTQLVVVAVLALIASAGTPAAPGAGAIVLFTILSGVGFINEGALLAYSLILAINRPIEMLVTALNVVGDAVTSICVAKSEGLLDEEKYNRMSGA